MRKVNFLQRKVLIKGIIGITLGIAIAIYVISLVAKHRENVDFEQDLNKINFSEEWQEINKFYKFTDEVKPETKLEINHFIMNVNRETSLNIKDVYMEWELEGTKGPEYRQLKIDAKLKIYGTAKDSLEVKGKDHYKTTVEDFMTVLDQLNLSEKINEITTKCEYYKIELRGIQKNGSEIFERREDGEVLSEEIDKNTGKKIQEFYKHKFFVFHDKTMEYISFGKTYTTKNDALDIVITPMIKKENGEYKGIPEIEIIYEINKKETGQ